MHCNLTFSELFCGGGGMTDGMIRAGYRGLWAIEKDKYAAAIYRYRFPEIELYETDITQCTDDFVRHLPVPDVLVWGFPCQDLSLAGNRVGFAGSRSSLFFEGLRFLQALKPRCTLIENVEGLLSANGGADFKSVLQCLDEVGYVGAWQVRNGNRWVPQNRSRTFIVARLSD